MAEEAMIIATVGILETTKVLIRSKLDPVTVEFRALSTPEETRQLLLTREVNVSCVLIDSDYQEDKGLAAVKLVRGITKSVPVIVMSSEQDRNYYINAIRWGVTGFIIKPFKDDAVRSKLLECYRAQREKRVEIISFDLERYLLGEFRKAEKGHYGLSFMFATVTLDDPDEEGNLMSQAYYLNVLYETIRPLIWNTDAYIRLNSRYYLGVFPFCGQRNIDTLLKKINSSIHSLHTKKKVPPYVRFVTVFSSYPEDGTKFLEVQRRLTDRVRAQMGDMTVEWFI